MRHFFTLSGGSLLDPGYGQNRDQMLAQFRAGGLHEVKFDALVYADGKNKNHTRLNPDELPAFAASFAGGAFLKDHSQTFDDRAGTILASRLEERNGKTVMIQTLQAVTPWAIEGYLTGRIDKFSIGWNADEYLCTVCESSIFDCKHGPFHVGRVDKDGKMVEVLMKGLEGVETSSVINPAVPGTGIVDEVLSTLQQLSASRSGDSPRQHSRQEDQMKERVYALLGLAADIPEQEALAALEKRFKAPATVAPDIAKALGLAGDATEEQALAKIFSLVPREELEKKQRELNEKRADELVRQGQAERKITPAMLEMATRRARKDPEAFAELLKDLPVQGPELNVSPPPTPPIQHTDRSDEEARLAAGLTTEEWNRAKAATARVN